MWNLFRKSPRMMSQSSLTKPDEILAGLIAQQILLHPKRSDGYLVQSYYDGHVFHWPEKNVIVDMSTSSYSSNSPISSIDRVRVNGVEVPMSGRAKQIIWDAFAISSNIAYQMEEAAKKASEDNRAIDAVAHVLGVE